MRWPPTPRIDRRTAEKCRDLVYRTAEKYDIPGVWITAHVRHPVADEARKEVWTVMIVDYGLLRWQVAAMFDRDRRRLRRSVIGA